MIGLPNILKISWQPQHNIAMEIATNIFDSCNRNDDDYENNIESDEFLTDELMDSMTSFRFIEPEVIIREFSMEHLKAMKNQRFDKDTLCLICPVCDKSFQRNSHLKRHLLIHTKEKPFKCDVCDREFNQSSTMKSHKKSVHSNHKPFLCSVPNCAKSFSVMSNLKMHQKSHSFVKEFPCRHCKRSFKYQTSLQAHEKMHVLELIGKN